VPLSGSAIRLNPYAHRHSLDPLVYRDLVARIVFVGAPSTGKTALCEALARRFDTTWMPEYGREYWERHQVNQRITLEQFVEIAEGHRQREDERILEANRFLFVDTEAMITRLFSYYYYQDRCDERVEGLADESATRYDLFFLCDDDIPYADTPDRSGQANRAAFQTFLRNDLAERKIPYLTVRGTLEERVERVARVLDRFEKYTSVAEHLIRASAQTELANAALGRPVTVR
jgi:HTH-type transcriptional regulator, transcriptional repressor of NAD biosynthesis genes